MNQNDPIVVAIAVSLYGYNVSPLTRAEKLYEHFQGNCAEMTDLVDILLDRGQFWATELAYPTAKVYIQHAMEKYGQEALERAMANERAHAEFLGL